MTAPPRKPARPPGPPRPGGGGVWPGRPPGVPAVVPPPSVPLSFLAAAALGLVACGAALIWTRGAAMTDPTADPVVAAAHFGVLATLSMGVAGALHQFTPVVTQRPLRSVALAWATFVTWLGAAWLLPSGIAAQQEGVVEAGGGLAAIAVTLLVVNLSAPLAARGKGHTVTGLRFALAGFAVTACFGVTYVADRRGNWFDLSGHVVLAHAVIGLFAWLGLTYVAVAEKLWPMFFLAHVPGRHRAGRLAVWLIPAGVTLLSPGLLASVDPLAWAGAAVLAAGLGAHLTSLLAHVRHRRRKADLHLVFVATAAGFLAGRGRAGARRRTGHAPRPARGLGTGRRRGDRVRRVAARGPDRPRAQGRAVHRVVGAARPRHRHHALGPAAGLRRPLRPLHRRCGIYALVTAAIAAVCTGFGATQPATLAAGGGMLAAAGLAAAANLSVTPALLLRKAPAARRWPPRRTVVGSRGSSRRGSRAGGRPSRQQSRRVRAGHRPAPCSARCSCHAVTGSPRRRHGGRRHGRRRAVAGAGARHRYRPLPPRSSRTDRSVSSASSWATCSCGPRRCRCRTEPESSCTWSTTAR